MSLDWAIVGIELAALIIAAVWVVGRIQTTVSVLEVTIQHLHSEVALLTDSIGSLRVELKDHSERITVLEVKKGRD